VLDNNTNTTKVEVGPQTYTRKDHERIVAGPDSMIMIPPRSYCIIKNPVVTDDNDEPVVDESGYKISFGDEEIRFQRPPFPLYPGEVLYGKVTSLQVVGNDTALRLRCIRDFEEEELSRVAGDEWLFKGPATYIPRIEVQVVEVIRATIIKPNTALKLSARKACYDAVNKKEREAGEEWLVRTVGAYLPEVDEEFQKIVRARVLTDKKSFTS
jgi:major vault protein